MHPNLEMAFQLTPSPQPYTKEWTYAPNVVLVMKEVLKQSLENQG